MTQHMTTPNPRSGGSSRHLVVSNAYQNDVSTAPRRIA